jgi:hypothetical protein
MNKYIATIAFNEMVGRSAVPLFEAGIGNGSADTKSDSVIPDAADTDADTKSDSVQGATSAKHRSDNRCSYMQWANTSE